MACEHVFTDAQNIINVEVHDAMLGPTAIRFEPGVIITHPRWCDTCVRRRTGLILQNHRHVAGYQGTKSDQEIYQLSSWSKGMRAGRIEAETMDWKNNTDVMKVSDTMLNNLSNDGLMSAMVGVVTIDEDPVMQALAERITQIPVGASNPNTNAFAFNPEYTRLELAFAYNEGRLEGMNYQLNLEAIVLQGQRGKERFRVLDETTGPYDVSLRNLVIERDVERFLNSRV